MKALSPLQLKELRLQNRVKRAAMARFLGVDYSTLYRWEQEKNQPPYYVTLLYHYYIEHRHGGSYAQAA